MIFWRPTEPEDCKNLAPRVREIERKECEETLGLTSMEEVLALSLSTSEHCGSVVDENHNVLAMCGVAPYSPGVGVVWLLPSDECLQGSNGVRFLRCTKGWLNNVQQEFPIIFNHIRHDNLTTIKWLRWAGFTLSAGPCVAGIPYYKIMRVCYV